MLKDAADAALERVNPDIVLAIVAAEPATQLIRVNLIPLARFVDRDMYLCNEATVLVQLLKAGRSSLEQRPGFHLDRRG